MNFMRIYSRSQLARNIWKGRVNTQNLAAVQRCQEISNEAPSSTTPPTTVAAGEKRDDSVGFMFGSIVGNIKKNIARQMAKSLASKHLYEACADQVNYEEFFVACEMPDTFQSWFYIMQLHVWMVLVRLRAEGTSGKNLAYTMVEIMWQDIEARIKLLDVVDTSQKKETMEEFGQQFFGLIVAYDEGLLGHDRVLASALWRNLFYNKANTDAEKLALMVEYVRKQIQHLEMQSSEDLVMTGRVDWLPLHEVNDQK
eukprot:TCONS_00073200-protein